MAYKSNATELVYNFICDKIQNGEWKPGEKIWTENKLSEELSVSRVAVRQAIDKLATTSVLRKVQGSGTYVQNSKPFFITSLPSHVTSDAELYDIACFRIYFESGNTELFIQNATEEDYKELHSIHEQLMTCDKNSKLFYNLDFTFHKIIAYGTKNSFIIQIFQFLFTVLQRNQARMHEILGAGIALKYHPLIMEYIDQRDPAAASLMMRKHMEETANDFQNYIISSKEKEHGFNN